MEQISEAFMVETGSFDVDQRKAVLSGIKALHDKALAKLGAVPVGYQTDKAQAALNKTQKNLSQFLIAPT